MCCIRQKQLKEEENTSEHEPRFAPSLRLPYLAPLDGTPSQADGLDETAVLVAHQFSPLKHKPTLFPVPEADALKPRHVTNEPESTG